MIFCPHVYMIHNRGTKVHTYIQLNIGHLYFWLEEPYINVKGLKDCLSNSVQTSTEVEPETTLLLEVVSLSAPAGAVTGAELGQSRVFWRGSLSLVSFSPMEACLNQDIFLLLLFGGFPVSSPGWDSWAVDILLWGLPRHWLEHSG